MSPSEVTPVAPGLQREESQTVTEELTAFHIGSGNLRVYGTPAMLTLVEEASRKLVDPLLPHGHSSVGVFVRLRHLAPTPIGGIVHARSKVVSVEGTLITFSVELWDEVEEIGKAEHQRAIIDEERFLRRVRQKTDQLSQKRI